MTYKKLIALPFMLLASIESTQAGSYPPSLTNLFPSGPNAPSSADFTFDSRGLTISVKQNGANYTLTATGNGNLTFYSPGNTNTYAGTQTSYKLTANFDAHGNFIASADDELKITSHLASHPAGSSALPANHVLYDATLTSFAFNKSQGDIAFETAFKPSIWSNQFTDKLGNESVYLFDQAALSNGGHGRLTQLVDALGNGDLSPIAGMTYSNVESFAVVPLPLPAALFGAGLTTLIGLRHQRRNNSK